ncbi:MAG: GIY-YIG nuclease family protein [Candidatus Jacksonbacteria bacterium]|jgi:predicted GIY-YIG superfamily endonuclease|nr:GIY-YIG nuclease family protein [Candidatus Jacksonbacteria bacterium]MBT6300858.1 GIY-YIG nuclease family protein [Candidatus Jacksonbacteria bacterium]MBT6757508.1 GIY-YIG nuclease family protein [Candidatus Jacksonbacteria bacterium]MBT6955135.1 GIY-YIG nuclease family protein [Candidatus Jacksonbacteria bacterium]MBT7007881.1 GIY-YIG nuclease family protein [Candidatus Jacksonbacteria bacterium]
MNNWILYILRCKDGSLYTGITTDLKRRIQQHNDGTGAKYTRAHSPVKLLWSNDGFTESEAKKEEARIKKLSRSEKETIITS